jgi:hypothetical protein
VWPFCTELASGGCKAPYLLVFMVDCLKDEAEKCRGGQDAKKLVDEGLKVIFISWHNGNCKRIMQCMHVIYQCYICIALGIATASLFFSALRRINQNRSDKKQLLRAFEREIVSTWVIIPINDFRFHSYICAFQYSLFSLAIEINNLYS